MTNGAKNGTNWWSWALGLLASILTTLLLILTGVQNGRLDRLEATVNARGERIAVLEAKYDSLTIDLSQLLAELQRVRDELRQHSETEKRGG